MQYCHKHGIRFVLARRVLIGCVLTILGAPQSWADPYSKPKQLDPDGFRDVFAQIAPNLYIAGQPTEAGLERVQAMGVTRVINLRTPFEMDNRNVVPFDEAAKIDELNMQYIHLPLGGPDTPYSPAALEQFAEALGTMEEPTLLHCTVAWRATHLWTAYLIDKKGWSFADAISTAQQLNLGDLPLAGFLGRELTVVPADDQ